MANKSKRQLAALVLHKLNGGITTPSAKYTERYVFGYLDAFVAKTIDAEYKIEHWINGDWLKAYAACEKYDKKRAEVYIKLPAPVLSLYKDIGIYQVSLIQAQDAPYVKQAPGARAVFSALESSFVGPGRFSYYVEGNKLFVNKPKALATEVLLKLIPATSGYKSDEPMNYPSNLEADIIQGTYELANTQVPAKMLNDSNPNTP